MWLASTTTVGPETAAEMPKSLESAVTEPRVTKAQPPGPSSMVSSPPPACAAKPLGPPGLGLTKPGAWMPERVITPAGFFERLTRAGLRAWTVSLR